MKYSRVELKAKNFGKSWIACKTRMGRGNACRERRKEKRTLTANRARLEHIHLSFHIFFVPYFPDRFSIFVFVSFY